MSIFESIELNNSFPFRFLINYGYRLTTPHFHNAYEIIYVKKGSINLGVKDKLYKLTEGQVFIVNSHLEHYIVPEKESIRYIYQFDYTVFGKLTVEERLIDFRSINSNSSYWDKETCDTVVEFLNKIKEVDEKKENLFQLEILSILLNISVLLMRGKHSKQDIIVESKKIKNMRNVFRYIEDHYQQHIYIDDIAEEIGYNTEYFSRFFKQNIGMSFSEFLLDYRLTKAKWDLITTNDSINEIIINNGFTNSSTFYRNFKDYTGLSPKEYRQKYDK